MDSQHSREPMPKLALAALGVVFGDIGTSPLYALRACLMAGGETLPGPEAILGVLSLIFWTIALTVSLKYVLIVLRNDNKGEGGVLALMALLTQHRSELPMKTIIVMGVAGTALFFGDGALTPAVTVLSAVEGLKLASPAFSEWVVPITVLILLVLFAVQKKGTGKIGVVFGPVMLLWFVTLGVMGLWNIGTNMSVLQAVNPVYAISFLFNHGAVSLAVIAGAFLAVTGGEALYADLGHFGRRPIQLAWVSVVWPGLLLCYFGQGALLLENPEALRNPFYLMVPQNALVPLVILASAASVIASQSIISGVFSIAQQAQQLGFLPRMKTQQTSESAIGQVYLPVVNAVLCAAAIGIVLVFRSSEALANAYGIAVSSTMVIETLLLVVLLRARQAEALARPEGAPGAPAPAGWMLSLLVPLTLIDVLFFVANAEKIPAGGWFPLAFGGLVMMVMFTWQNGRKSVTQKLHRQESPVSSFLADLERNPPVRVPGTAVFLTSQREGIPRTLIRNLRFNGVLHETTIIVSVTTARVPKVSQGKRITVIPVMPGLWRVNANIGFKEEISIPGLLRDAERLGLSIEVDRVTYYLGREQIQAEQQQRGMAMWRKRLFLIMARNAEFAGASFQLPPNRIVEMSGYISI